MCEKCNCQTPATARAGVDETALTLARELLRIAYAWNDHNCPPAHVIAREAALQCGIKSFEEANAWIDQQGDSRG